VVHGTGLSNGAEVDAWVHREVGAELALLALVEAGVVLPKRFVLLTLGLAVEGQDCNGSHLAIARGDAEVSGNVLTGALGTLVDAAACALLRRGIGIEGALAVDAFTDHEKPRGGGGLNNYRI